MPAAQERFLPVPFHRFWLLLWVWHAIYLGSLFALLITALVEAGAGQRWLTLVLAGCVLLQAGLYVAFVINQTAWPLSGWPALFYFGGTLLLWVVERQLDERFIVLGWIVMGQLFGLLRPRFAIPATVAIMITFTIQGHEWPITQLSTGEVVRWFGWFAMALLFLSFYGLMNANLERSRLIIELQAAQAELEASRRDAVNLATLRERERLAREMHDGLGHSLVVLSVQLEAIQRLYRVDPLQAAAQIEAMKDLVRSSMEELRRSLAGLRTPGLAKRSLRLAVEELCAAYRLRSTAQVVCQIDGNVEELPPMVAEALWRVAQEAFTNIEKHAQAGCVAVELKVTHQEVVLQVSDDGIGVVQNEVDSSNHFGLMGMSERVEGLGGQLTVANGDMARAVQREANCAEAGVHITARIPLHGSLHKGETNGENKYPAG